MLDAWRVSLCCGCAVTTYNHSRDNSKPHGTTNGTPTTATHTKATLDTRQTEDHSTKQQSCRKFFCENTKTQKIFLISTQPVDL